MEKEKLHLGDAVVCHVKEDMEAPFTGKIEKVYENSALLSITDYADKDRQNAAELNFKIVANFHAMTQNLGGGTVLAFPPEPAEEPKKETFQSHCLTISLASRASEWLLLFT